MRSDPGVATARELADQAHFNRIVHSYTRKDEARSSRVARKQRLAATLGGLPLPNRPAVLEVGCGAGYAVDYAPFDLGRYFGIDHSEQLISVASDRHQRPGVEFRAGRIQDLESIGQFDCVFVIGVLHHLEQVDVALDRMVAALRPGGWLAVNEPQPANPLVSGARWVRKRVDKTYSPDQVEFRADELTAMFRAAGLINVETRPQGFLSTPFAEVPLPLPAITERLARAAVRIDQALERRRFGSGLAWNCVAVGQRPSA